MTQSERKKLQQKLDVYDEERARGLVHDHAYVLQMERYRMALND